MKIYALKQAVPAGVLDARTEFFSDAYAPMAFQNGLILSYDQFPPETKEIVYKALVSKPAALQALIEWGFTEKDEQIQQYLLCTQAILDNNNPDIDENGVLQEAEYVPCERRGACRYEGIICSKLKLKNGSATPMETKVLTKVGELRLDKEICNELGIQQSTLRTHKDRLFTKTGMSRKEGLVKVAHHFNLIQS